MAIIDKAVQRIRTMSKRAFDKGLTSHSNTLIGRLLLANAKKLPKGQTKDRQTLFANYVLAHPELCYADFKKWCDDQWYPDYELLQANLDAVRPFKATFNRFVRGSAVNHPELKESEQ